MTPAILSWLALSFAMCAMAWFTSRSRLRAALLLAACTLAALPGALLPLSHAAPWQPAPGTYTLIGGRIDVDVAIWALLAGEDGEPRLWRLPYTTADANGMQEALNALTIGGTATAKVGEGGEGGVAYDGEPPVTGTESKAPEAPVFGN